MEHLSGLSVYSLHAHYLWRGKGGVTSCQLSPCALSDTTTRTFRPFSRSKTKLRYQYKIILYITEPNFNYVFVYITFQRESSETSCV